MGLVAFVLFVVLPIAEIYVMVLVAGQVGWGLTLFGLLFLSLLGIVVIRGTARAAREIARASSSMSMTEVSRAGSQAADAGFRLLGGVLLVIPGFVTGFVGLLLLLPPIRFLVRGVAGTAMIRRYPGMQMTFTRIRLTADPGSVIQGEVVDSDGAGASAREEPNRDEGEGPPRPLP